MSSASSSANTAEGLDPQTTQVLLRRGYHDPKVIGRGKFGQVACAYYHWKTVQNEQRRKICAVKVIERKKETETEAMLFEREVMALSMARHQRIVQIWEHFKFSRAYFITMEWCSGGSLETLVEMLPPGHYFSHDFALLFSKDLASALHFLHEQNITHRDLKPENVLFDAKKRLKLADFGFAKKVTSMRSTMCGTDLYKAPELLRVPKDTTHVNVDPKKLDVWGFGLLSYLVFANRLPFLPEEIVPRDRPFNQPWPTLDITPKLKREHKKGTVPGSIVSTLRYSLKADPVSRTTMCTIQGQPWYGEVNSPRD